MGSQLWLQEEVGSADLKVAKRKRDVRFVHPQRRKALARDQFVVGGAGQYLQGCSWEGLSSVPGGCNPPGIRKVDPTWTMICFLHLGDTDPFRHTPRWGPRRCEMKRS